MCFGPVVRVIDAIVWLRLQSHALQDSECDVHKQTCSNDEATVSHVIPGLGQDHCEQACGPCTVHKVSEADLGIKSQGGFGVLGHDLMDIHIQCIATSQCFYGSKHC